MKVKLLRPSRIKHDVGEIVEVSPTEAHFLISVGSAQMLQENTPPPAEKPENNTAKQPAKNAPKKKTTSKKTSSKKTSTKKTKK